MSSSNSAIAALRWALAATICGLLVLIVWEVMPQSAGSEFSTKPAAPATGAREMAINRGNFTMPPYRSFAEVLERPLFAPTRRPAAETGVSGTSQPPPSRLVGIVISPDERVAILEIGERANIARVPEGGHFAGWTIEQILSDRIIVVNAQGRAEIKPQLGFPNSDKPATRRGAGSPAATGASPPPRS